jgi:hypothetical protein
MLDTDFPSASGQTLADASQLVEGPLEFSAGPAEARDTEGAALHSVTRFEIIRWNNLPDPAKSMYRVKGVLPLRGLIVVYGAPKECKSFWVLDLSLHIAFGRDYRGCRTKQGDVIYIVCEGQSGFCTRVIANARQMPRKEPSDFFVMPTRLNLTNEVQLLIADIARQCPCPAVIVLDTLSRTFDGDENTNQDMSKYVEACGALEDRFGCAVVVVHHAGHDKKKRRPRGASSLMAAADTLISVGRDKRSGVFVAEVQLMKDGPEGAQFASTLKPIELSKDEDGDPIQTCVVVPARSTTIINSSSYAAPSKVDAILLETLRTLLKDCGEPAPEALGLPAGSQVVAERLFRDAAYKSGISNGEERAQQAVFKRGTERLLAAKQLATKEGLWWLL